MVQFSFKGRNFFVCVDRDLREKSKKRDLEKPPGSPDRLHCFLPLVSNLLEEPGD